MVLTEEELEQRLGSKDNIINLIGEGECYDRAASPVVVEPLHGDVGKRGAQVPDLIRRLIGQVANDSDETQVEIANVFGVGAPTVSNSARGLVHNRLDPVLRAIGEKTAKDKSNEAHEAALDNLMAGLDLVSAKMPEAEGLTLKETVKLSVDMTRIVSQLKPAEADEAKVKTLVVIKMPSIKKEAQFDTIDV